MVKDLTLYGHLRPQSAGVQRSCADLGLISVVDLCGPGADFMSCWGWSQFLKVDSSGSVAGFRVQCLGSGLRLGLGLGLGWEVIYGFGADFWSWGVDFGCCVNGVGGWSLRSYTRIDVQILKVIHGLGADFGSWGLDFRYCVNGLGVDFCSHGADSNGVGVDRFIAEAKAKSEGLHANPRI